MEDYIFTQKDEIIERLKHNKYRITKQRLVIIDSILENNGSCYKEIYYQANKKDKNIGMATVYRMMNTLEEIGAIGRENGFRMKCNGSCQSDCNWKIVLEDNSSLDLTEKEIHAVLREGLAKCGYIKDEKKTNVRAIEKSSHMELLT